MDVLPGFNGLKPQDKELVTATLAQLTGAQLVGQSNAAPAAPAGKGKGKAKGTVKIKVEPGSPAPLVKKEIRKEVKKEIKKEVKEEGQRVCPLYRARLRGDCRG